MRFPSAANWHALVLVVDDDPASARRTADMVREAGHRPVLAHNWTTALRVYRREPVDLVLMDAVMPGMDGFKLTQLLRNEGGSYVPVVFVTGLEDRKTRELCMNAGADDLLIKPVSPVELGLRLTAMLRIRRLTLDLAEKGRALEQLAHIDPLTGVANRRAFEAAINSELVRARRYEHPLCLIVGDIDHFKRINDLHGHLAGDFVLKELARLVQSRIRRDEVFARYGGEEFCIILPETTLDGAVELGERLRQQVHDNTFVFQQDRIKVTISVGCAVLSDTDRNAGELLKRADERLYEAKNSGRNRVCY